MMQPSPLSTFIQKLLAKTGPDAAGMTDGELLARFLKCRDEEALAALVWRHSGMVWSVCRRHLFAHHDAEDAFQATFLVLVRKSASVPRDAVANWLYGVARQTAVRLRATKAKQDKRETPMPTLPETAEAEVRDADLRAVLDEELCRLPGNYRNVVVLCDLEGMTRKEAARQLDVPEGSVASRLARAREMLAKRLTRRGVTAAASVLAAALTESSASASVPHAVVSSTITVAKIVATGQAAALCSISAEVSSLTQGVLRAMFFKQLKWVCVVALVVSLTGGAAVRFVPWLGSALHAQTPEIQRQVERTLDLQRLQGTWTPVAVVAVEESGNDKNMLSRTRLIIKDDTFRVVTQFDLEMPVKEKIQAVVMEGRLEIDPQKTPKTMDWRVENPKLKQHILKVYEVDGDKLKIFTGSAAERPLNTRNVDERTKAVYYQREPSEAKK